MAERNLVGGMLDDGAFADIAPDPLVLIPEGHWLALLVDRLRIHQVQQFRSWSMNEAGR